VLARLVAPGPYLNRVTLQYRPLPAAAADRVLESEVTSAAFRQAYRHRLGRDETARNAFDQARARHAAREEAMGAGVCLVGMFVTVTVLDAMNLPQAVAATEAAAESSKVRLRLLTGSQAAGFAALCPVAPVHPSWFGADGRGPSAACIPVPRRQQVISGLHSGLGRQTRRQASQAPLLVFGVVSASVTKVAARHAYVRPRLHAAAWTAMTP
jgi:hypothetical protein